MKELILLLGFGCSTLGAMAAAPLTDSIGYFLKGQDTIVIYEVGAGETLSAIARKYSISVTGITNLNPNLQPDALQEGQILKIPGANLRKQYRSTGSSAVTSKPQVTPSQNKSQSHTIMQGETLYAIARHFNVSVEALIEANPGLQPDKIYAGQVLQIPGTKAGEVATPPAKTNTQVEPKKAQAPSQADLIAHSTIETKKEEKPASTKEAKASEDAILHVVQKGETMFSLSRQYDVTVTDIKSWNALSSFQIDVGDELIVGYKQSEQAPAQSVAEANTPEKAEETPVVKEKKQPRFTYDGMDNILSLQYKEDLSSNYYVEERNNGIASWISDVDGYPYENGYFALHRTLPIGTVVKVRNLMNDKIIFAKVIGRLPNTDANEKIMLKLPEAAKEDLKVLDAQLVMEVSYLRKMN